MRHALTALALGVIAALLAAIAAPYVIDWSQWRGEAGRLIERQSGIATTLEGPLDIRLLPSPTLKAGRVRLVSPDGSIEVVAKTMTADLSLTALLRAQVVMTALTLDEAEAHIDLARLSTAAARPAAIEALTVTRSTVVASIGAKPLMMLNDVAAQGSYSPLGGLKLDGSWQFDGAVQRGSLAVGAGEGAGAKLAIADVQGRHTLALDGRFSAGPLFEGRAKAELLGTPKIEVMAPVTLDGTGLSTTAFEGVTGTGGAPLRFKGALRWPWDRTEQGELLLTIGHTDFDTLGGEGGPAPLGRRFLEALAPLLDERAIKGAFDFAGGRLGGQSLGEARGDFRLARGTFFLDDWTARLPGGSALKLAGQAVVVPEARFRGQAKVDSQDPAVLVEWISGGLRREAGTAEAASLEAGVDVAAGLLSLEPFSYRSKAGAARGRLAYRGAVGPQPLLDVALEGESFALDALRPLLKLVDGAGAPPVIEASVKLNRADFAGQSARNVDVDLRRDGSRLMLKRFKAEALAGADVDLTGVVDITSPRNDDAIAGRLVVRDAERLVMSVAPFVSVPETLKTRLMLAAPLDLQVQGNKKDDALRWTLAGHYRDGPLELTGRQEPSGQRSLMMKLEARRADALLRLIEPALSPDLAPLETPSSTRLLLSQAPNQPWSGRGDLAIGDTALALTSGAEGGTLAFTLTSPNPARVAPLFGLEGLLGAAPALAAEATFTPGSDGWSLATTAATWGAEPFTLSASAAGPARRLEVQIPLLDEEMLAALLLGPGASLPGADGGLSTATLTPPRLMGLTDLRLGAGMLAMPFGRFAKPAVTLALSGGTRLLTLNADGLKGEAAVTPGTGSQGLTFALKASGEPYGIDIKGSGRGASARALVASLSGEGTLEARGLKLVGAHPLAMRDLTLEAEARLDGRKGMGEREIGERLKALLERQVSLEVSAPLRLSGTVLKAGPATIIRDGGEYSLSGAQDLMSGEQRLTGTLSAPGPEGSETRAHLAFSGAARDGAFIVRAETEDALSWLSLRLVERELSRIGQTPVPGLPAPPSPPATEPAPRAEPPRRAPAPGVAPAPRPMAPRPPAAEGPRRAPAPPPSAMPLNILPVP